MLFIEGGSKMGLSNGAMLAVLSTDVKS